LEADQKLSDAGTMARRSIRFSWSNERALRRALGMLERLGDRAGAARLYEDFRARLAADLDLAPSAETEQLMMRIRGGS
jgi:DNA-binding SARP family transcriptional activator